MPQPLHARSPEPVGKPASGARSQRLGGRRFVAGLAAGLMVALPLLACAAVPVQESVGVTRDTAPQRSGSTVQPGAGGAIAPGTPWYGGDAGAPVLASSTQSSMAGAAAGSAPTSQNAELFFQIQTLQQEVQTLRGMVEELTHQVNRLAADQQAQYRDLDGRMLALRGGAAGAPAQAVPPTPVPPAGPATLPAPSAGAPATAPAASATAPGQAAAAPAAGEREAYSAAFELMRARKFPEATAAFTRFVRDYPNSSYTANSFYWLGELYLAQENMEQARQSFTQVINLYPDSQKVPDALYKLGVVQHRLGDVARAREYLNRAVSQYPGSSAAALAQTYLSELQ